MSTVFICDGGCGKTVADKTEFSDRGIVDVKSYCGDCIGEVDIFIEKMSLAHTKHAGALSDEIGDLSAAWLKEHTPGGELPDAGT